MAACSRCGTQLKAEERFCGNCGLDTQAQPQVTAPLQAAPQESVSQPTAPRPVAVRQPAAQQAVYTPAPAQAGQAPQLAQGQHCGCTARAAMGLGIGGGLLGIVWGALGPYLTVHVPKYFEWAVYGTGLKDWILLAIGIVAGLLAIVGASLTKKALGLARVLLVVGGLGGFLLGASWLMPGALILAAAGLAMAAKSRQ